MLLHAFTIFTSKSASRRNSVRFLKTSTSKSAPELRCFEHSDLEMYFAPQRRALFEHLNFQKCSGAEVFQAFWLRNEPRATTVCTLWTSQLPKVLWSWGVLSILTWKRVSRHNGVHSLNISTSRTRHFVTFLATTAYIFWTSHSQLPKMVRQWYFGPAWDLGTYKSWSKFTYKWLCGMSS